MGEDTPVSSEADQELDSDSQESESEEQDELPDPQGGQMRERAANAQECTITAGVSVLLAANQEPVANPLAESEQPDVAQDIEGQEEEALDVEGEPEQLESGLESDGQEGEALDIEEEAAEIFLLFAVTQGLPDLADSKRRFLASNNECHGNMRYFILYGRLHTAAAMLDRIALQPALQRLYDRGTHAATLTPALMDKILTMTAIHATHDVDKVVEELRVLHLVLDPHQIVNYPAYVYRMCTEQDHFWRSVEDLVEEVAPFVSFSKHTKRLDICSTYQACKHSPEQCKGTT